MFLSALFVGGYQSPRGFAVSLKRGRGAFAGGGDGYAPPEEPPPEEPPAPPPDGYGWNLGINLSPLVDYSPQFVFKNLFLQSRPWISGGGPGAVWDDGYELPLTATGYPASLRDGYLARALMAWDLDGYYPQPQSGYQLGWDGTGSVSIGTFASGGIELRVTATTPADPVRNIRYIIPGEDGYEAAPFLSTFTDIIQPFRVLRFMDWNRVNNSTITAWSERTPSNWATQAGDAGVSYETMISLCNSLNVHPWISIPHAATDDYITQLATLVRDTLNTGLICYFELSNEIWNGQFTQYTYFQALGLARALPGDVFEQGLRAYSERSVEMFAILDTVFGGDRATRTRRVMAGQAGNGFTGTTVLGHADGYLSTDIYATAPYFYTDGATSANTVDEILDMCLSPGDGVPAARETMAANVAALAAFPGVEFAMYEGGQHLTTFGADPALDTLYRAVNRHPRMQDIYAEYLDAWQEETGDALFCHYSSVDKYGNFGSWGSMERYEDVATAPKYLALLAGMDTYTPHTAEPFILTIANDSGTEGQAYTLNPSLSNLDSVAVTWSVSGGTLPPGLSLNTSTGAITGTPTTAGTYSGIILRITYSGGTDDSPAFTITVASAGLQPAAGMTLWLDGADDGYVTITSGKVSTWTDKAQGITFNQTTAGNRPIRGTMNGKDTVFFEQYAGNVMTSTSTLADIITGSTYTAYAVVKASVINGTTTDRQSFFSDTFGYVYFNVFDTANPTLGVQNRDAVNTDSTTLAVPALDDVGALVVMRHSGGNLELADGYGAYSGSTASGNTDSLGGALRVGRGDGPIPSYLGDLAELIIYDTTLSGADHTATISYLYGKWFT